MLVILLPRWTCFSPHRKDEARSLASGTRARADSLGQHDQQQLQGIAGHFSRGRDPATTDEGLLAAAVAGTAAVVERPSITLYPDCFVVAAPASAVYFRAFGLVEPTHEAHGCFAQSSPPLAG